MQSQVPLGAARPAGMRFSVSPASTEGCQKKRGRVLKRCQEKVSSSCLSETTMSDTEAIRWQTKAIKLRQSINIRTNRL